jgi:hypothetical protein
MTYLEHIKNVGQFRGRLAAMQGVWDQYTRRVVKEYQDFLLIVKVTFPLLWLTLTWKRLLCFCREYTFRSRQ